MDPRPHHLPVTRTARYFVLGRPPEAEETWVVVHGYGQSAERFCRVFTALPGATEGRRAVVAPEALSRWYVEEEIGPHGPESRVGASWMTREDRENEIRDYVAYLDRVVERLAPPGRLVVLGFSQGCETASRWITLGETRPAELVLWGGGLGVGIGAGRLRARLDGLQVRLVVGDRDRWGIRRSAEAEKEMETAGVSFQRIDYPGGHRVLPEILERHWP